VGKPFPEFQAGRAAGLANRLKNQLSSKQDALDDPSNGYTDPSPQSGEESTDLVPSDSTDSDWGSDPLSSEEGGFWVDSLDRAEAGIEKVKATPWWVWTLACIAVAFGLLAVLKWTSSRGASLTEVTYE
jgi:hypothetical protein